jgi:two-component system chemotaxis response regulator CheY
MLPLMIVDDSNVIRRKIDRFNQKSKIFKVVAMASNGRDALRKFGIAQPKVVTMDLTMPHMDGIECIEELMARDPSLHILVISALKDKATGIEALQKGASGFLCKPFTERQLEEALLELVENQYV